MRFPLPLSAMFHWFFVLVESSEYYKKDVFISCQALSTELILTNVNKGQVQLKARFSSKGTTSGRL